MSYLDTYRESDVPGVLSQLEADMKALVARIEALETAATSGEESPPKKGKKDGSSTPDDHGLRHRS